MPVDDILETVLSAVPVESALVMQPEDGPEPLVFGRFRDLLGTVAPQPLARADFYAAARRPDLALAIASGDQRLFANILLTIGVVTPA